MRELVCQTPVNADDEFADDDDDMSRYGAAPAREGANVDEEDARATMATMTTPLRAKGYDAVNNRFSNTQKLAAGAMLAGAVVAVAGGYRSDGGLFKTLLGAGSMRTVEFSVDIGCMSDALMESFPVKDFFDHDVTGVGVVFKGNDPLCEFGGQGRSCGRLDLTQDGYSTTWKGTKTVAADEEYAFTLTNSNGDSVVELGYNKRFPESGSLADDSCLTVIHAGGGVYMNRLISADAQPTGGGTFKISRPWGGCRVGGCETSIKLIATVGPNSGSADNVFAVEEADARTATWRAYKGHFSAISSGVSNTWGLDTITGALKWSRNVDFNIFTGDNWVSVNNNARYGSQAADGPAVDFDVGYNKVYAVTQSVDAAGGRIWSRNVDGSDDWQISGSWYTSRLIQVTIGRTHLWGVNGHDNMYTCVDPCVDGSSWTAHGGPIKQVEVGESHAFTVSTDDVTLKRGNADASGGWTTISLPSTLTGIDQVAVGATSLWILDTSGGLHACTLPCSGGSAIVPVPNAPAGIISIDAGKVA